MFEHKKIRELNDFFLTLDKRAERGIYFYRICGYHEQVREFLTKYYQAARQSGVVIEGRIPNPDEKNLAYYEEIMGQDFMLHVGFVESSLKKWLPRMNASQRGELAAAIYDCLLELKRAGKNDNILKNAYIKFMCWLYYKFERLTNRLGANELPKILYEGDVSNYELLLLTILAKTGCDIVLVQYHGDDNYRRLDAQSLQSELLEMPGLCAFPQGFGMKQLREQLQRQENRQRLYGALPSVTPCTNAWIAGKGLRDVLTPAASRGNDGRFFYNCLIRIRGVEDKLTYINELYQFYLELKNTKRNTVIIDGAIAKPGPEEIARIERGSYADKEQMLFFLSKNIQFSGNREMQSLANKAFLDVMLKEADQPGISLNKLMNKAVYLLCWLRRYQRELFGGMKLPETACLIVFGGCREENEVLFYRMMAALPVDVLFLAPNLQQSCQFADDKLYEIHHANSLSVSHFPREGAEIHMGTAAYHAERELDEVMYRDSGLYRNMQYKKANSVTLQTMYEEIAILWNQEVKYRPNFATAEELVTLPVIFAKVSGVKERQMPRYWSEIKALITEDTLVVKEAPFISSAAPNPMRALATEFYKNGKLRRQKIKAHPQYPYGVLREEMQEHIFDKLQLLIDQRIIKGTMENGMEYTIVAAVFHLPKEVVRLIQKFDFTKKNPKLIYINTTENPISLEDAILLAFLNLVGFDILLFVPTGYQIAKRYFNKEVMEEHQIGDYVYDLAVPDFSQVGSIRAEKESFWNRIFKR